MTYKPKTTTEQRAAMLDVVLAKFPNLSDAMMGLLNDLDSAEEELRQLRMEQKSQPFVCSICANERLKPIDDGMCTHDQQEQVTDGWRCTKCGRRLAMNLVEYGSLPDSTKG